MEMIIDAPNSKSYQRAIIASKKARFSIEDVLRGRNLVGDYKFLPDGLSLVTTLDFLNEDERRLASRVQGRTYANLFGLVERYINTMVLELAQSHSFGDQVAVEALVRFSEEELKHQELFRRVEKLCAEAMPSGYHFAPTPNEVAKAVLSKSRWAVLALTCHIELFTLAHYKHGIEKDSALSPLWRDVFLHHFMEESQHAVIDELEWLREDARLNAAERDRALGEFLELLGAVDGILQMQSAVDADFFLANLLRKLDPAQMMATRDLFLRAYRYQFVMSGVRMTRFPEVLFGLITHSQRKRVEAALAILA